MDAILCLLTHVIAPRNPPVFSSARRSFGSSTALAEALTQLKALIIHCSVCFNVTQDDPCRICRDPQRDVRSLCVLRHPLVASARQPSAVPGPVRFVARRGPAVVPVSRERSAEAQLLTMSPVVFFLWAATSMSWCCARCCWGASRSSSSLATCCARCECCSATR